MKLKAAETSSLAAVFEELPSMLAGIGITPLPEQVDQMRAHFNLLVRWNRRINLTSIREPSEILKRHFVESAFLTKVVKFGSGRLIDVGSGAGFPGLPVKVLVPEIRLTLVEPVQKKVAFLKEAIRSMGLNGADALSSRVEDIEGLSQWITVRGVRVTPTLFAVLARLLVPRGTLALFLGVRDARDLCSAHGFEWHLTEIPETVHRVILTGVSRETV